MLRTDSRHPACSCASTETNIMQQAKGDISLKRRLPKKSSPFPRKQWLKDSASSSGENSSHWSISNKRQRFYLSTWMIYIKEQVLHIFSSLYLLWSRSIYTKLWLHCVIASTHEDRGFLQVCSPYYMLFPIPVLLRDLWTVGFFPKTPSRASNESSPEIPVFPIENLFILWFILLSAFFRLQCAPA